MRIGIIAALPGELKPFVKGWSAAAAYGNTRKWTRSEAGDVWVAACSGMGADSARRAFVAAESDGPLDLVLSIGWAGALDPAVPAGEARVISAVFDARTGEKFELTGGGLGGGVVTAAQVADSKEKRRLGAAYPGTVMVDMEAATIARMAQMRQIPVACIKGVSDDLGASLPDINPFIGADGQLRMVSFLAYLALRPRYWSATLKLGGNSKRAAFAMSNLITDFLKEKHVDQRDRPGNA